MGRVITSLTLRPETLQVLNEVVLKAQSQDDLANHLGLRRHMKQAVDVAKLNFDSEGLSPKDYTVLTKILGAKVCEADIIESINRILGKGASGEARALEALQYLNASRKSNLKLLRRAEAQHKQALITRKSVVNNSRVAEALILIGVESLGNACDSKRSSKPGFSQSSNDRKAAGKSLNHAPRQANAPRTGKRTTGVAA